MDTLLNGSFKLLLGKVRIPCFAPHITGQEIAGQTIGIFMLLNTAAVNRTGFAGRSVEDFTIGGIASLTHGAEVAAFLTVCSAAA